VFDTPKPTEEAKPTTEAKEAANHVVIEIEKNAELEKEKERGDLSKYYESLAAAESVTAMPPQTIPAYFGADVRKRHMSDSESDEDEEFVEA
jgi:hypothetical protein